MFREASFLQIIQTKHLDFPYTLIWGSMTLESHNNVINYTDTVSWTGLEDSIIEIEETAVLNQE